MKIKHKGDTDWNRRHDITLAVDNMLLRQRRVLQRLNCHVAMAW